MLSVLIPTYKRSKSLSKCLESIIVSNVPACEVLIADDGGDSDTIKVIKNYKTKLNIRYIPPSGKGSLATNITRLFKSAKTDWVLFIHDDDFLVGDHSRVYYDIKDNFDFFFTDHYISNEKFEILSQETVKNSMKYGRDKLKNGFQCNNLKLMLDQNICLDGFYIKRSIVNIYPIIEFGQVADYFWLFQVLLQQNIKIGYSSSKNFAYVISADGLTSTGGRLNEYNVVGFEYMKKNNNFDEDIMKIIDYKISLNTWYAVNSAIRRADYDKAMYLLKNINFNYMHSFKHKFAILLQILILFFKKIVNI